MRIFVVVSAIFFISSLACATPYRQIKVYQQNSISADDSKIKSCLKSLYASQMQFRKSKGYFSALADDLKLTRYQVCDGLEISTHMVTESKFKMTAKFNHKIWSVDEHKNILPQRQD